MDISGAEAERVRVAVGVSVETLWMAYMRRGGTVSCAQIEGFLSSQSDLAPIEREVLAAALHDRLGQSSVSDTVRFAG